jgi:hypothetical protein
MTLNDNDMDKIGKVLLVIFCFLMLMFSIETEKEYKQLIKDIKKTLKYSEHEINRQKYAVIKYGWVADSVWVYYNQKAFSAVKLDLEYLNSKL